MKKLLPIILSTLLSGCFFSEAIYISNTLKNEEDNLVPLAKDEFDDVSKLNRTKISQVFKVSESKDMESELLDILKKAKEKNLKISIAGKRHSMGGQTIYPNGIVIDMLDYNKMDLNKEKSILTVQSGALWSDIIPYLDKQGFAIKVMQSDSPFSVGGSISVNCHGWQNDSQPIASTVDSFRILTADGKILKCSRTENQELFSLALGGYGLFGIILDVDLKVVKNELYSYNRVLIGTKNYVSNYFEYKKKFPNIKMAYGRISIAPDSFLKEAIFYYMLPEETKDPLPEVKISNEINYTARGIFRGSVKDDFGKNFRWKAEKEYQPFLDKKIYTRNQLMIGDVKSFANNSKNSSDILHEYFIPADNVNKFIEKLGVITKEYKANMINITVRNINKDTDTFLRYANQDVFSFVISFNYETKVEADKKMEAMTQKLIDETINLKGAYYLPYRLHATKEQFLKVYPQASQLLDLKKKYDPDLIFQNKLFEKYF